MQLTLRPAGGAAMFVSPLSGPMGETVVFLSADFLSIGASARRRAAADVAALALFVAPEVDVSAPRLAYL